MAACLIDLFEPCPIHHTVHHQYVTTLVTADEGFPSPEGTEQELSAVEFDFEDQMLAHAYAEARQLVMDTRVLDSTYSR